MTNLQAPPSRVIAGSEATLALPLGELSPKVTDTELQLKSFLKILIGVQYEKFFFLRPHLRQFIAECGNCHLFIHKFIISHSAVFGTFFCAVLP